MRKYEVNGKITKMSGESWASKLGISIVTPQGWPSFESYGNEMISREEFLNRASNSVIIPADKKTRRDAAKMKQNILNNE